MRNAIYYWKCDRPAALHGVRRSAEECIGEPDGLRELLRARFGGPCELEAGGGQGNHRTFRFQQNDHRYFVRVEDGPEGDVNLSVESRLLEELAQAGVPAPQVWFTDVSRARVCGAVQVIEFLEWADLGALHRAGRLAFSAVARQIGRAVATWQGVPVQGFGPFQPAILQESGRLQGWHDSYRGYFHLNLDNHLARLVAAEFLTAGEAADIRALMDSHGELVSIQKGCLVHKDLALWNMLGTDNEVRAFIDWDDAIAGDPTDDLSLLGCFYSAEILQEAIAGYREVRALPEHFLRRFWLHLIRNLLVKSVIRCEAGYFEAKANGSFLMTSGQDGEALRSFTLRRLRRACRGLANNEDLEVLDEN